MSRAIFTLLLIAMLGGCAASIPEAALRLPESTLEVRSIQTRTLAAPSEIDILTATIAVLQDMEFNIERIEKPLGGNHGLQGYRCRLTQREDGPYVPRCTVRPEWRR